LAFGIVEGYWLLVLWREIGFWYRGGRLAFGIVEGVEEINKKWLLVLLLRRESGIYVNVVLA